MAEEFDDPCDDCGEAEATLNFQKVWEGYKLGPKGEWVQFKLESMEVEEPVGDDNRKLCRDCAEKSEFCSVLP